MNKTKLLLRVLFMWLFLFSTGAHIHAHANDTVPVYRLSGADRYQTAAAVSREGWKTSEYVVLAVGEGDDKFADALAGSPIAAALNAPILLTPTREIDKFTQDEIIRLGAKKAILLGGPDAISQEMGLKLQEMGLSVERFWGTDRYETAVKIGDKIKTIKQFSKIFLTTGEEFQYAMMIAPFASKNGFPIIFSQKEHLSQDTADAISRWGVNEVDIIGSSDTIASSIEEILKNMGIAVKRVGGQTLSETNINIINTYKMDTNIISAARDDLFADGLTGAPFASMKNMPLILTGQAAASPIISDFLGKCNLDKAYVFGGPNAISDYIVPLLRKGITDSPLTGNYLGNINNAGLAVSKDGWTYYHDAGEGGKLYKVKIDGTGKTKISSDISMNINVVGDWVYYSNLSDSSKIYKIKADGTCKTKLNDDESLSVTVMDNWIYYVNRSDNDCLYKITSDGSLKTRLSDYNVKFLNVKYDWIYFIDKNIIHRIKSDNPTIIQQLKGFYISAMEVAGGQIYFLNEKENRNLYKINIDGTGLMKLGTDRITDYQVMGEWVYYTNSSFDNKLHKIKSDGTGETRIYDGSAYLFNIAGDWIYFSRDADGAQLCKIRTDGTGFAEIGSSPIKEYIQTIRELRDEHPNGSANEGGIKWVEVNEAEDGIPVKDAFNNDGRKIAFLTFDDGPSKSVTPWILDILKEYDIKATFFIVGSMAQYNGEIVKRIYSEGHSIGNHSYSHEYSHLYSSMDNFWGEVEDCEKVLVNILGDDFEPNIFRFPGGAFGSTYSSYKAALNENGYEYINWNVSTGDSTGNGVPVGTLIGNLKEGSYGKDHIVVLMHDLGTKSTTAQALPEIIEYLISEGYEFRKLI